MLIKRLHITPSIVILLQLGSDLSAFTTVYEGTCTYLTSRGHAFSNPRATSYDYGNLAVKVSATMKLQGCESFGFYPSIRIYVSPSSYSDGFYVTDTHLRILRDAARGGADRALWRKLSSRPPPHARAQIIEKRPGTEARNRLSNETLSASLCLQFF